tara:strand:+ start:261 stop:935 length:675 start_codon:yes stop_codon:yes gene_type:complete
MDNTGNDLMRLESRGTSILAKAKAMKITDNDSCHQVDLAISQTVGMLKERETYWEPILDLIKKNLELTRNKKKEMMRPVQEAQDILVEELAKWKEEEANRYSAAYDKKKEQNKSEALAAAFVMAEQGEAPEAIKSMTELATSDAAIEIAHYEVKTKTSVEPDWEVELIKGQEHLVPAKWLIPSTDAARKAVARTIKKEVVTKRGQVDSIPGVTIKSIFKSIKRG